VGKQAILALRPKSLLITMVFLHMRFRLAPRAMTLDDLELLYVRILSIFSILSQIWEAKTAKYRPNCSPLNVYFSAVCCVFHEDF